ncbi:unnamed protein product, partial [Polarella glacialis]
LPQQPLRCRNVCNCAVSNGSAVAALDRLRVAAAPRVRRRSSARSQEAASWPIALETFRLQPPSFCGSSSAVCFGVLTGLVGCRARPEGGTERRKPRRMSKKSSAAPKGLKGVSAGVRKPSAHGVAGGQTSGSGKARFPDQQGTKAPGEQVRGADLSFQEDAIEEEEGRAWQPGDFLKVNVDRVSWSPAVKGGGEGGKYSTKQVLQSVSWKLLGAEKVGLIGANGCGKSTQLLMLQDLIETTSGRIVKLPPDMRIAFMQQEADLDNGKTTFEEIHSAFADRPLDAIDKDIESCATGADQHLQTMSVLLDERAMAEQHISEVEMMLHKLGMTDRQDMTIPELSSGWQMRLALGKILLSRPNLLLLDEPTNHVDVETVEFMERLLRSEDIAMVIVSHDRYFLNQVCTKIVEIYRGKAKTYKGNYVQYLRARDSSLALEWKKYQRYQDNLKGLKKQLKKLEERFILETAAEKRRELDEVLANPVPKPEVLLISDFRFPSSLTSLPTAEPVQGENPVQEDDADEDLWEGEDDDLLGKDEDEVGAGEIQDVLDDLQESQDFAGSCGSWQVESSGEK